jgi:hypothetical protein
MDMFGGIDLTADTAAHKDGPGAKQYWQWIDLTGVIRVTLLAGHLKNRRKFTL